MVRIEVSYVFEVKLDEEDFENNFINLKNIVENNIDKFVLSNKHLLKENKVYYDLIS